MSSTSVLLEVVLGKCYVRVMCLDLRFYILCMTGLATLVLGLKSTTRSLGPGRTLLKHPLTTLTVLLKLKLFDT